MNAHLAAVDRALIGLFEDMHAERPLAELGPVAFHRVVALYRGGAKRPARLVELIMELRRASLDCWAHAMHVVALANPDLYLEYLERLGDEMNFVDVSILERMDDPRAAAILTRHRAKD